jgi:hypothetical protein
MNDTSESMDRQFRAMLMTKSGAERLHMGASMFDSARGMMLASLPKDLPPHELRQLILARTYPELIDSPQPISPLPEMLKR